MEISDIFFLIATLAIVASATIAIVLLVAVIGLINDARYFMKTIHEEAEAIMDDVEEFRKGIKNRAGLWSRMLEVLTAARLMRTFSREHKRGKKRD